MTDVAKNGDYSVRKKSRRTKNNIIGRGMHRLVYDLRNGCVLKVAKSKIGINSNKREVSVFRFSLVQARNYLAEIIDYDRQYRWVKMKKYNLRFPLRPEFRRKLNQLRSIFRKNGIVPWDIVSRTGKPIYKNLRLKNNGAIVVIDYGNFRFVKKG